MVRSNKTSCGEKYNSVKTRIVQFSFPLICSAKPGHTTLFSIKQTIFMKSSDSLFVKFCLYLGHKSPNTIYTHLLTLNLEISNVNIMCRSIIFLYSIFGRREILNLSPGFCIFWD